MRLHPTLDFDTVIEERRDDYVRFQTKRTSHSWNALAQISELLKSLGDLIGNSLQSYCPFNYMELERGN
ncbi:hypothetical protein UFOVP26_93 [uncultured Caudovirales phage]|uniref:Uncharacterized protein n=1 Tax=uncultured Caudovirales phage TaxID=2100421 RepID=A0A6J7WPQ7_9CAUD|nr:hypothetical protein UFOVP26_93 [uncultured Caudovirales phage]CAB4123558.1 hypothetical protein UFOVP44_4 [uncultured Caudovirales phage]CAB5219737.1 hypothetical protein UFOVP220_133 [uncultured Caudovirales phage]